MKLTRHDKPIGHARVNPIVSAEEYTFKKSDQSQMSWEQLCVTTGLCPGTFYHRVHKQGMSRLGALKHRGDRYNHVVMSIRDICAIVGTNYNTYMSRRNKGWPFRDALLRGKHERPTAMDAGKPGGGQ